MRDDLEKRAGHELGFAPHAIRKEVHGRREESRARVFLDDLRDPFWSHVVEPVT
jgi:hypothetical protein